MLAAWHRYKYPHLSVGAIASGAPVDFYPAAVTAGEETQAKFDDAWLNTWAEAGDSLAAPASASTPAAASASGAANLDGWCRTAVSEALDAASKGSAQDLERAGVQMCDPPSPDDAAGSADAVERFLFYAKGGG